MGKEQMPIIHNPFVSSVLSVKIKMSGIVTHDTFKLKVDDVRNKKTVK